MHETVPSPQCLMIDTSRPYRDAAPLGAPVMYLVTATSQAGGGISIAVATTSEAVKTAKDLVAKCFKTIVLDHRGRERSLEQLELLVLS